MRPIVTSTLSQRLWITIAIAIAPVILFALFDYQERRDRAVQEIYNEIDHFLGDVHRTAQSAHETVENALKIMARANDLDALDAAECSGIASRLSQTFERFANIGAALPDGSVFCSAQPLSGPVNVSDRVWFRASVSSDFIGPGEFVIGRITGKPGMVFGYPLRGPSGELFAVLFAAINLDWFEHLFTGANLPADWEASVISHTGQVLARHRNKSR